MTNATLKFSSRIAELQYNQVHRRDFTWRQALREVLAFQWISLNGGLLPPFADPTTVGLAILTSGGAHRHEITRYTVLCAANSSPVVDWDLSRIARSGGQSHVPDPDHPLLRSALALDRARAERRLLKGADQLAFPSHLVSFETEALFPTAEAALDPTLRALAGVGSDRPLNQAALEIRDAWKKIGFKMDGRWYIPAGYVPAPAAADCVLDMRAVMGATVRNPIAGMVRQPNPWLKGEFNTLPKDEDKRIRFVEERLPAVRRRLGAVHCLFDDAELIGGIVDDGGAACWSDTILARGRQVSVQDGMPLLTECFGEHVKRMSVETLELALNVPATPVNLPNCGKITFMDKTHETVSESIEALGINFPEVPEAMWPKG